MDSEVLLTPTNIEHQSESTPSITLNDNKSFVWPCGGLTNFEKTNTFLRLLQQILTSGDMEDFAIKVNRAVKCLFSNKIEMAATFVIHGETGRKKVDNNSCSTGDLYILDKEDETRVNIFTI